MKKIALVLIFILLPLNACAEGAEDWLAQTDIAQIQNFSDENDAGIDVLHIIEATLQGELFDTEDLIEYLKAKIALPMKTAVCAASGAIVPVLLMALLSGMLPDSTGSVRGSRFVLTLALLGILSQISVSAIDSAETCMRIAREFTDMIAPVLTALISAAGMNSGAALISPSSALAGNLIGNVFSKYGVLLCRYTLILALASGMCLSLDLSSLVSGMKKLVNWCCGLAGTLFAALVSVQSSVASSMDSAAAKTARYTVDSFGSIIGSGVSDAWSAYISGVSIAKNAVGISGSAVLLAAGIKPIAEMLFAMLVLKLIALFLNLIGESRMAKTVEELSGVCQMALALSCSCIVIAVILISAVMFAGNGLL